MNKADKRPHWLVEEEHRVLDLPTPHAQVRRALTRFRPVLLRRSPPHEFHAALGRALNAPHGENLTEYSIRELEFMSALWLSGDGRVGYARTLDRELVSLFSTAGDGRGVGAILHAVEHGATHLNAFEPFLPALYHQFGFRTFRLEANWTPGEPPVAYMRLEYSPGEVGSMIGLFPPYQRPRGLKVGADHPLHNGIEP